MRMSLEIQRLNTPEAIRDEVTERFQRGGFADINQARQTVEREKRDAEGKTKDAELARLKAENERLAAAARANETHHVPGGHVREGPAPSPDGKTRMTFKEAEAMTNQIRNTQGRAAAMEFEERIGKDIEIT